MNKVREKEEREREKAELQEEMKKLNEEIEALKTRNEEQATKIEQLESSQFSSEQRAILSTLISERETLWKHVVRSDLIEEGVDMRSSEVCEQL